MIRLGNVPFLSVSYDENKEFHPNYARIKAKGNKTINQILSENYGIKVKDLQNTQLLNYEKARNVMIVLWYKYLNENQELLLALNSHNGIEDKYAIMNKTNTHAKPLRTIQKIEEWKNKVIDHNLCKQEAIYHSFQLPSQVRVEARENYGNFGITYIVTLDGYELTTFTINNEKRTIKEQYSASKQLYYTLRAMEAKALSDEARLQALTEAVNECGTQVYINPASIRLMEEVEELRFRDRERYSRTPWL